MQMVDKGIPIRLVLYSVAILYLVVDFFVIAGPLRQAIFRKNPKSLEVIEAAKRQGVVARVYYQPILLSQVDRRVEEDLWKAGRLVEGVKGPERKMLRQAALGELIDLHLLRLKIRFNQDRAVVEDAEVAAELESFRKRFAGEQEFRDTLAARGWSEKELEYRLAARIQQERYLRSKIQVQVEEEEARAWFGEHREELALPERVRARHIFRATLDREAETVRAEVMAAKGRIEAKEETFEDLAMNWSEDPRSKENGGDLGWMQAGRLPPDFATPLFRMKPGEMHVVQTTLGWHLVEVLELKPRTLRTYEEARADVLAALEAVKREDGLKIYRQQLRAFERHKIEIFPEVLERGLAE